MRDGRIPYLVLFGQLGWQLDEVFEPLRFGRPALILVALAERQPGWVSVEELIDLLWVEPPARAVNAVQRHVSLLRKHLRQFDQIVVDSVLEHSTAGYRLPPTVRTDLCALSAVLEDETASVPGPSPLSHPRWWSDPLSGEEWDGQRLLRSSLEAGAHQMRDRWIAQAAGPFEPGEAINFLILHLDDHPRDRLAASSLLAAAGAVEDPVALDRAHDALTLLLPHHDQDGSSLAQGVKGLRQPGMSSLSTSKTDYRIVAPVCSAWGRGDLALALELLEKVGSQLPDDVQRRLERCLRMLGPADPWALVSWQDMVSLPALTAELAEKMLVSLDAYALEQKVDSLPVADREVRNAPPGPDLIRALRVRFIVGLGHPMDHAQRSIPERLATMDDVDAQTEAHRYRGILASKAGDFEESLTHFDLYARLRDQVWPDTVDDFDQLARFILGQARRTEAGHKPVVAVSVLPIVTNHIVVEMTMLWVYLQDGTTISDATLDQMLQSTVSSAQPECGSAFELLRLLSFEPPARPSDERLLSSAEDLLRRVLKRPPNRNQHAALVVIAQVACLVRNRELANGVLELIQPWVGEQLGIWPMDIVFGPAALVIAGLEAI